MKKLNNNRYCFQISEFCYYKKLDPEQTNAQRDTHRLTGREKKVAKFQMIEAQVEKRYSIGCP